MILFFFFFFFQAEDGIRDYKVTGVQTCALPIWFLQHVERTRLMAVLVPVDSPDPQATYELLLREASLHSAELAAKPHIVVLSKLDLLPAPRSTLPEIRTQDGAPVVAISAVTGEGVPQLLETLWQLLPVRAATS